ncbi:putative cysteine proteinase inhibitor 12 [Iris pallida]|uniref:Cysteine proteinase inhibitor n=1 Tax=Iris pallida TaxID=29817 RepID=A0AAX6IGV8_IRIPA|nr:putative cysteine proteinase inhibitor 12 [Iris pallida]
MSSSSCFLPLLLLFLCTSSSSVSADTFHHHQFDEGEEELNPMATLGGVRDSKGAENSLEAEELARFAVDEHNKKENALLEFVRVVKAKEQVVSGTLHHLTLEVVDAGKKKLVEAKVWVKPWLNFKELQEFKQIGESTSNVTHTDLGAKRGDHTPGWRTVPAHDPVVKDAAEHAVKTIQQRSNSLAPYELSEILSARGEVTDKTAKLDLLLKLKRGGKEEKYKVEVHKDDEGTFNLKQMEQEHRD